MLGGQTLRLTARKPARLLAWALPADQAAST
jgi:hypothetical protein